MIKLNEKEKLFIKKQFPNKENLLNTDDVNEVLILLDKLIAQDGLDENYRLTDFGREAQKIYDNIFINN